MNQGPVVGLPIDRVDGRLKVCGAARYAAEFTLPRMVHAVMVQSTMPKGRIVAIDTAAAERTPGVLAVLTHRNAPRLPAHGRAAVQPPAGRVLSLLQDDRIDYHGQPIAVVVADSLEHAQDGARALKVRATPERAALDFEAAKPGAYPPAQVTRGTTDTQRGDLEAGLRTGAVRVSAVYGTPMEHHNPMEPHATIAAWEGGRLTLYDSTQYVSGVKRTVARTLGMDPEQVHVVCPFVGGGFGCKGSTWSHVVLAAMAARVVGRPVKLVLARPQMFGPVGGRPRTEQTLRLAAARDGRLTAMEHAVMTHTSFLEDWTEPSAMQTRMLYACPNQRTAHRLVKLNLGTPTFQRAPGEATGTFALECAMDELAHEAGMDPLALRIANETAEDPDKRRPFSSRSLLACYRAGAERFGWARRNPAPRSMRDGRWLVGLGLGTATYPANRSGASARVQLLPDGTALAQSGTQDLGTGTYTVMTQVAADALGYPVHRVRFELGDSRLPPAPVSGGSQSAASVAPAVREAALAARAKLIDAGRADPRSPFHGASKDEMWIDNGWLRSRRDPTVQEPVAAVIARSGPLEAVVSTQPGAERERTSLHAFGAVFSEVHVDPELGIIRVPRVVGAYGVGRILNAKTAHSQLMGGIVWGLSMALFEESLLDPATGRFVNANLAEYHVPVNADVGEIEVMFVPEDDPFINALGVKGIGEIGITGVAGSIANAVHHATGRRVRELPITLDKLL